VRAGKTSDESSIILRVVPRTRNDGVDDVVREALSGEVPSCLRSRASACHDALGTLTLALERRHRIFDELGVDTRAQQVVTDVRIARPAIGEPFSPRLGESAIVARRGAAPKTARYLAGKGFSYDVVESLIAQSRRETLG